MNIKEVCEVTGLSADTIRYYERIGLVPKIARKSSGVRDFAENDIAILEFVRCFRSAGMSIERLIEYMGLVQAGDSTVEARIDLLKEEQEELRSRLLEIQQALDRLDYKIENYQTILRGNESELFDEGRRASKKSGE
ncbi:MerR family transcriptional regulator [Streptococcus suis]|uniref:MerR family transcriptional regulator n=1 Tax=Streptococcus suis TaxID=1307 RepID=A0A6L8MYY5_STRSU|nr:stress response transcriptional regulator NmlR [Streptococcus parasuis]MYN70242.1 MerR family transcriptional regulator [Streptococcus suis]MDG4477944.1 MerR family transcriptional regulator [Streptococcus parasuis]NQQ33477.1 MerR family transcriptional regulator [Streptococcus suis]BCP57146.1 MerR family transcriptional regulator [Streptococcus parasuis]BCP63492.1 MerR family transcriptional regulator [Streptococcus parasuis]